MKLDFEWDIEKEKVNIQKHGISFKTAELVFDDENRLEIFDEIHSDYEDRYITIGMIGEVAMIVMVSYTMRNDESTIRIISARRATKKEKEAYYYVNR
jgi:uncharacterized DUF497 family protein